MTRAEPAEDFLGQLLVLDELADIVEAEARDFVAGHRRLPLAP